MQWAFLQNITPWPRDHPALSTAVICRILCLGLASLSRVSCSTRVMGTWSDTTAYLATFTQLQRKWLKRTRAGPLNQGWCRSSALSTAISDRSRLLTGAMWRAALEGTVQGLLMMLLEEDAGAVTAGPALPLPPAAKTGLRGRPLLPAWTRFGSVPFRTLP